MDSIRLYRGGFHMDNRMENLKYSISEALELPKDIVMDLPKIIMVGNIQLNISNHKGIIEYSQDTLRVNSNIGIIKITGSNLKLKTILSEEIVVDGTIDGIEIIS